MSLEDKYSLINIQYKRLVEEEDRQTGTIPKAVFELLYKIFGKWKLFVGVALGNLFL
jgi:hypothetical protein